ncbi:MAG: chorismate-binding protein [Thermoanaerobaculia bacterium]
MNDAVRGAAPLVREFLADGLTPSGVYRRLRHLSSFRFLLESVTGGEQVSRYSFLGACPRKVLRLWPDRLEIEDGGGSRREERPLEALAAELAAVAGPGGDLPFQGGWVGYFGYDLVRFVERLGRPPASRRDLPVALLARFDSVVVFDHARQRVVAVANQIEREVGREQAQEDLRRLGELLTAGEGGGAVALPEGPVEPPTPRVNVSGPSFRESVARAQEHIAAGDVFQVVLARRFELEAGGTSPLGLYRALRRVNPSPYMVLFESPDVALVGTSPEMLVRKVGTRVETRPIAGTRPRHPDPAQDRRLAAELAADAKERAEHVMLVDLGRNDLGRICRGGTVEVSSFMEIERYSHVMHLCSTVEGVLAPGVSALDALLACFPAGTVSGAPKVRAMELIDELEGEGRGPYAGAVGYLSFAGDLDTCITIRTLVVQDGEISVTAGAGIVADSDPATEERETESKAAALLAAAELARRIAAEGAT